MHEFSESGTSLVGRLFETPPEKKGAGAAFQTQIKNVYRLVNNFVTLLFSFFLSFT
jgi:hypothetical protein